MLDSIAKETVMIKVGKMAKNQSFVDAMEGKVWLLKMTVKVISDEKPSPDAITTMPTLEDAYLYEFEKVGVTV